MSRLKTNGLPNNILVIDEIPVIAYGLHKVFQSINPSVNVRHEDNILKALTSPLYRNAPFDLVILGTLPDNLHENMQHLLITDLRTRFKQARVMIYVTAYSHVIIEQMEQAGVDAYVHKHESPTELQQAYMKLSNGSPYISEIFHTLYHDYKLNTNCPGVLLPRTYA